jgi:hypothetical protein
MSAAIAGVSLFGILNIVSRLQSHATTAPVAFEAENGTLNNGASIKTDSAASNGHAIAFQGIDPTHPYGAYGTYKPSARTTGVPSVTQLTAYTNQFGTISNGFLNITTPGITLSGYDIAAYVNIEAANVTIKNSLIEGPNFIPSGIVGTTKGLNLISTIDGRAANFKIIDSTLAPIYPTSHTQGIQGHSFTSERNNIYDTVDGFDPLGPDVILTANYIHDLSWFTIDSGHIDGHTHNDCIQPGGGSFTASYNNLEAFLSPSVGQGPNRPYDQANSVFEIADNTATGLTNIVISNNWIDGGQIAFNGLSASGTTWGTNPAQGPITVINNSFGDNQYYDGNTLEFTSATESIKVGFVLSGNTYEPIDRPLHKPSRTGTTLGVGTGLTYLQ